MGIIQTKFMKYLAVLHDKPHLGLEIEPNLRISLQKFLAMLHFQEFQGKGLIKTIKGFLPLAFLERSCISLNLPTVCTGMLFPATFSIVF